MCVFVCVGSVGGEGQSAHFKKSLFKARTAYKILSYRIKMAAAAAAATRLTPTTIAHLIVFVHIYSCIYIMFICMGSCSIHICTLIC